MKIEHAFKTFRLAFGNAVRAVVCHFYNLGNIWSVRTYWHREVKLLNCSNASVNYSSKAYYIVIDTRCQLHLCVTTAYDQTALYRYLRPK